MKLEELKRQKKLFGLTAEEISKESGVPLSTIQKIFSGVTQAPRKATLDAIVSVLESKVTKKEEFDTEGSEAGGTGAEGSSPEESRAGGSGAEGPGAERSEAEKPMAEVSGAEGLERKRASAGGGAASPSYGYPDMLSEEAGVYRVSPKEGRIAKRPGEYTIDDYYALPDERRVELIDGVFYDMAAPAIIHQKILGELFILFRECVDRHEGKCEVYLSPCDVRLDRDNRTMVQPDLLVVCEDYDLGARAFDGAPDLTLEILSPSTCSKDMFLKLHKYSNAGVREYWIVDPERKTVLVYDLEHKNYYPEKYSFEDQIPIGISGGECCIDFSRILRRIERYYR